MEVRDLKVNNLIAEAIEIVKSFGYKCYFPLYKSNYDGIKYFYFTDGKNIGNICLNEWDSALILTTVHIPTNKIGTGFTIYKTSKDNWFFPSDLTDEVLKKTFVGKPFGYSSCPSGVKYKDWEDYKKNSLTGKLCKEFIEL